MRLLAFILFSCLASSPILGAAVDEGAPPFSLQEMGGEDSISLEDYKGKVVYLDFWASWCGPCRKSFPALSDLRERYADQGFEVIAVNLDQDLTAAHGFVSQFPVEYPLLKGFGTGVGKAYHVEVMPTAYLIDGTGTIRTVHHGFKPEHVDFLDQVIQKLLAEL